MAHDDGNRHAVFTHDIAIQSIIVTDITLYLCLSLLIDV